MEGTLREMFGENYIEGLKNKNWVLAMSSPQWGSRQFNT